MYNNSGKLWKVYGMKNTLQHVVFKNRVYEVFGFFSCIQDKHNYNIKKLFMAGEVSQWLLLSNILKLELDTIAV